jgi:hypothetical protein
MGHAGWRPYLIAMIHSTERQKVRMARFEGCHLPDRFPIKRMKAPTKAIRFLRQAHKGAVGINPWL